MWRSVVLWMLIPALVTWHAQLVERSSVLRRCGEPLPVPMLDNSVKQLTGVYFVAFSLMDSVEWAFFMLEITPQPGSCKWVQL